MSQAAPAPPVYDPRDPAIRRDPFPLYRRLRAEDPVHWSPVLRGWILTRFEDVRRAHAADELSSDRITPFYEKMPAQERSVLAELVHYLNLWLVFRKAPEHTRLRRLLNAGFTAQAVQSLQPRINEVVDGLLDQLEYGREVDLIARFATLVPAMVIMHMLGVPVGMLHQVKEWTNEMALFIGSAQGVADKYERAAVGAREMSAYFRDLIAARRAEPTDDILSRLIAARDDDDALSEDELIASCMLMLFGGHETTTNLIGNAAYTLCRHPDQRAKLLERPELIGPAIEEVLRYDGPSNSSARIVAVDHELGGKALKAGDRVFAMVNAANRDPEAFEDPETFDIERSPNRHVTFGYGIHFCLGSQLARLEGKIAVGELVRRFPDMRLGPQGEPEWVNAVIMRGLRALPVVTS